MTAKKPKLAIAASTLKRWATDIPSFIDEVLRNPETGSKYSLYPGQVTFLNHIFTRDATSLKLLYPEAVANLCKKQGKSELAAMLCLNVAFAQIVGAIGAREPGQIYILSSDLEQSQSIIYGRICKMINASDLLRPLCRISDLRVEIPSTGTEIICLPNHWQSAGGLNPAYVVSDECRSYGEMGRVTYEEMVPSPARTFSGRLTVSHRGITGQEPILADLVDRAETGEQIAPNLWKADGLIAWISHTLEAPWTDEAWKNLILRTQRSSTARQMINNMPSSGEDQFVDEGTYDRCVDDTALPSLGGESIYIGTDIAVRKDAACCVAVAIDKRANIVRMIDYRCVYPSPTREVDIENDIERYILELSYRHKVNLVLCDPFQFYNSMQRLAKRYIRIEAFNQTSSNLSRAAQNLYSLFRGGNLRLFPSVELKEHAMNTVIFENKTGSFRIGKHARKGVYIDLMAALSFACIGAVDLTGMGWGVQSGPFAADDDEINKPSQAQPARNMSSGYRVEDDEVLSEMEMSSYTPTYRGQWNSKDDFLSGFSKVEKRSYTTGAEGSVNPYDGEDHVGFVLSDEKDRQKLQLWSQHSLSR